MSNSKVSSLFGISKSEAKMLVSDFLRDTPRSAIFRDTDNGITVLAVQEFNMSDVTRVSVSIMSPTETKFRKSVGDYIVVTDMLNGQYTNIPTTKLRSFFESLGIWEF